MRTDVPYLDRLCDPDKPEIGRTVPAFGAYTPAQRLDVRKGKAASSRDVRSQPGSDVGRKSPLMIGTFLVLWVLSLAYYGPRLWQLVATSRTVVELALLSTYCAMLITFWLLTAYYIAVVLFSFIPIPLPSLPAHPDSEWPAVAILYPTCNDFQPEATTSCLNQDYPNFHLFLLDDSTEDEFHAAVEAFHAAHRERTTIVRRPTRQGFKAGNLNHALRGAAAGYPLFAVVDADERLPPDFLRRTVPYLRDSSLAFVQANHAPNPDQDSAFARDIAPTLLPFWHVHCRPRNRYGFVTFLGHGAVVRRSVWEAVGGLPEVVLEDIAFSAILGERGMRGLFLENLICREDFPISYLTFKRQQERYIIGTTQMLCKYLGPLLRSRKLSLIEKIDFCLWCSPLYVPALCLLFIALSSFGIAGMFGNWQSPVVSLFGQEFALPAIRVLDDRFAPLWHWDFQLFSVLSALSPAFACMALGAKGKLRARRLLFLSIVPYMSLMVVSWRGILGYLLRGRIFAPPTGERMLFHHREGATSLAGLACGGSSERAVTWRAPRIWEICIGGLLMVASLASFNLALGAVSCCLLMGVFIEVSGWERRVVRIACMSCFAVILLQMLINVTLRVQSPGLVPLVFSVHF